MHQVSRLAVVLTLALCGGCGTMQYEDTNRAVDARPECATGTPQPGEPVPPWCERKQSVGWSTGSDGEPLDLSGSDDD